jgi:hypothetical protein
MWQMFSINWKCDKFSEMEGGQIIDRFKKRDNLKPSSQLLGAPGLERSTSAQIGMDITKDPNSSVPCHPRTFDQ